MSHEDWLAAVDKVLKGRSFDDVLRHTTLDGIVVEPLYVRDHESPVEQFPGEGTGRRASNPAGNVDGWDIRQRHRLRHDAAHTNATILADLQRGVTSIELDTAGIEDQAMLEAVLTDVYLDLAPVALRSDGDGVEAAQWLLAVAAGREVPASALAAHLGCDPIGSLTRTGSAGQEPDRALAAVAALASNVSNTHPQVRTLRADGSAVGDAGASPATELAFILSTGVAYLRALSDAGMSPAAALDQILLTATVGTDQFGDTAKLRALRVAWARIAEVVGAPDHRAAVQAVGAELVLTESDPWSNMLRSTLGCFASATGGADIITVMPFDSRLGLSDELGMRIARNTQLVLMEESNLHRVIDPGGGSWYIERLTDQLADEAWAAFQAIEAAGGIVAALRAGTLQEQVNGQWAARENEVAQRVRPITGVSEFPNLDEEQLDRPPLPTPAATAASPTVAALPRRTLADGFERLRRAARAASSVPTVFLATLGPVAAHTARAGWATNFFEAGGIRAVGAGEGSTDGDLVEAYRASGARFAVLCSSNQIYEERAADAATALHQAGAERVYLAGDPGDNRSAYEAGGVDEFVHVGIDVVATLERAHRLLGIRTGGDT